MEHETPATRPGAPNEKQRMPRLTQKRLLVPVVIGALAVAALVTWRGQAYRAQEDEGTASNGVPALDARAANIDAPDAAPERIDAIAETIASRFEVLSDRIEGRFEASAAERARMNHVLADLADDARTLQASVAELENGRGAIEQRIADTHARLEGVAHDIEGIKAVNQARAATQRHRTSGEPPFRIDAIDIWDDVLYVVVSRDGKAAFLREGERQSGWQVTQIDYGKGEVIFRRPDGQTYTASVGR